MEEKQIEQIGKPNTDFLHIEWPQCDFKVKPKTITIPLIFKKEKKQKKSKRFEHLKPEKNAKAN